ncbi:Gamma-tubulin complex component 4 [Chytridiales sp. JEL 0842]|nr:Gamma-tubulin complex component 4 [Chytridiales sp. JEL 0842]
MLSPTDPDTPQRGRVPLSYLIHAFAKYEQLFPHILDLLDLTNEKVKAGERGIFVIDELFKRCTTGIPTVQELWLRTLTACNAVLGKQLLAWMVYGIVDDPFNEFFIRQPALGTENNESDSLKTQWETGYVLEQSGIPSFVSSKTANNILFVGRAMATIRNSKRYVEIVTDEMVKENIKNLSVICKTAEFRPLDFEVAISQMKRSVAQLLWNVVVLDENLLAHLEACRNYYLLGRGDFYLNLIEQCDARLFSAEARFAVMSEHEITSLFVKLSANTAAENDPALALLRFKKLDIRKMDSAEVSLYIGSLTGTPFKLEYAVNWPLDLIFTAEDIEKYNDIFNFLIALKRAQIRLHRIWTEMNAFMKVAKFADSTLLRDLSAARNSMIFFIECLWSYVQVDDLVYLTVDVISVAYHEMVSRITHDGAFINTLTDSTSADDSKQTPRKLPNFEDIQLAHKDFIDTCIRGCFLDSTSKRFIGGTLKQALSTCDRFYGIIHNASTERDFLSKDAGSSEAVKEIRGLLEEFNQHTAFLFRIFSGVNESVKKTAGLDALLLRLDHNLFYSLGARVSTAAFLAK